MKERKCKEGCTIDFLSKNCKKALGKLVYVEEKTGMPTKFKVPTLHLKVGDLHAIK